MAWNHRQVAVPNSPAILHHASLYPYPLTTLCPPEPQTDRFEKFNYVYFFEQRLEMIIYVFIWKVALLCYTSTVFILNRSLVMNPEFQRTD